MLLRFFCTFVFLAGTSCIADYSSAADVAPPAEQSGNTLNGRKEQATGLVRHALRAEVAGENERRAGYLNDALAADPNYAPAHWQSGQVHFGNRWVSIDDASAAARKAGKIPEYRERRDHGVNTLAGHLQLARWCEAAGLKNEERVHLVHATDFRVIKKKQKAELIHKLGLVRYRGALMTQAQAEQLKTQVKEQAAAIQAWKPTLIAIRRQTESSDQAERDRGLEQLQSLRDPQAIPALEALFVKTKLPAMQAIVTGISQMPGQAAADSLVRHALFDKSPEIREAAGRSLKTRPLFAYAPTLIAAVESPVEVEFSVYGGDAFPRHRLEMHREGPVQDFAFIHDDGAQEVILFGRRQNRVLSDTALRQDASFEQDLATAQQQQSANAVRQFVNGRVAKALELATDAALSDQAQDIWKWWLDSNEMYQPPYKSVQTTDVSTRVRTVNYISCFPAGTLVETSTGPLAIEQIRGGDCVLAQDPDSGELSYKPVMTTTVRPLSPVVEIMAGGETIRATRGHPFWVAGVGWQMAKELKAGQRLHTPAGSVEIESAQQNGEAECYNLVVADFNSYFVGEHRFLVHDNLLRQVTTATVPGLVEESGPANGTAPGEVP